MFFASARYLVLPVTNAESRSLVQRFDLSLPMHKIDIS